MLTQNHLANYVYAKQLDDMIRERQQQDRDIISKYDITPATPMSPDSFNQKLQSLIQERQQQDAQLLNIAKKNQPAM